MVVIAEMHPTRYRGRPGSGEEVLFDLLRDGLKPDERWVAAHEPGVNELCPDFVLYARGIGVVVLEVKDWSLGSILPGTDQYAWILEDHGRDRAHTAPNRQARGYVHELMDRVAGTDLLRWPQGSRLAGKPMVPIDALVVFPNIRRQDYLATSLVDVLPPGGALFAEDLDVGTGVFADATRFAELLESRRRFPMPTLAPDQDAALVQVIAPTVRRRWRGDEGPRRHDRMRWEMIRLDRTQARAALQVGRGHRLVKGPPGSGKTILLAARAAHLAKHSRPRPRVMLLAFNLALVSHLRRLILDQGVGLGRAGVEVRQVNDFDGSVLGERVEHAGREGEYYADLHRRAVEATQGGRSAVPPYDAILIDEGQDFSADMLRTVVGHLVPGGDLVIALDPEQDLYARQGSWASVGIDVQGRVFPLRRRYRGTRQIIEYARRLADDEAAGAEEQMLFAENPAFEGPAPEVTLHPRAESALQWIVEDASRRIAAGEYRCREVAVVYDEKVREGSDFVYGSTAFVEGLLADLEGAGIAAQWISSDVRSKQLFDPTTDSVSLISLHSAKGLEWDLVYLVGLENLPWTKDEIRQSASALRVAVTRACHRLVVVAARETAVVGILRRAPGPSGPAAGSAPTTPPADGVA